MGRTTCYFADPSDLATPVVDLNGLAWGDPYGFQLLDVDWGGVDSAAEFAEAPPTPAGELIVQHHPIVEGTLRLFADFNSAGFEIERDAYRLLGQMLDSHAVIVWQPEVEVAGSALLEPAYFDTYPSPIAAMFRGQDKGGLKLIDQLLDPDGYPLVIRHHPYPRSADEQVVTSVGITNGVNGSVVAVTNPGTALSECRLAVAFPEAGARSAQVIVGRRSRGNLTEFATLVGASITGASAVGDYRAPLWRKVISPTDGSALAGTFRVLATVTLSEDIFHLWMASGWVDESPLPNAADEVTLEADDLQTFHETEVDLGTVVFDENAPSLVIEVQGRREGSGSLSWGQLTLVPADESYLVLSSPGQRGGRYARQEWSGEELIQSPGGFEVSDDGQVILDAQNERVSTPPTGGFSLPEGRHVVRFNGFVRNKQRTKAKLGELQVLENGAVIRRASLYAKRGQFQTRYGPDERRQVQFDADPAKSYIYRVEYTAATTVGRTIHTNRLRSWFIPTLHDGRMMILDSGKRQAQLANANGTRIAPMRSTGLLYLPPGDSALVLRLGDVAASGYDSVDARERLVRTYDTRQAEITVDVTPRHLHP